MKNRFAKEMLKSLGVVLPSLLPLGMYAQSSPINNNDIQISSEECCCPAIRPGEPLLDCQLPMGYPQYAGVDLNCGWNLYFTADFLYWTVQKENNAIAIRQLNDAANHKRQLFY